MSGFSALTGPLVLSGVAVGPLYEVDGLADPLVHLRHRHHVLSLSLHIPTAVCSLAADTTGQDRQWLHAQVFAELEILEVTKTHALMVAPGVLQLTALFLRTDSGLPAVGVPEAVAAAVNYASAGETHELRLQVCKSLSEVLA